MKLDSSHFIAVYSVACKNIGSNEIRQDYCSTEPRKLKHLVPFLKSVGNDMVAVFIITPKKHLIIF